MTIKEHLLQTFPPDYCEEEKEALVDEQLALCNTDPNEEYEEEFSDDLVSDSLPSASNPIENIFDIDGTKTQEFYKQNYSHIIPLAKSLFSRLPDGTSNPQIMTFETDFGTFSIVRHIPAD